MSDLYDRAIDHGQPEPDFWDDVSDAVDEWLDEDDCDDFDIPESVKATGGIIERKGCHYCFACGMLAQPGDEEFDWCDHLIGDGCSYLEEQVDDDDDYYDEDELE